MCVCVSLCACSLQCIVINTDRQVLTWDCSPGERLQAFPWHPSRSYQRTDCTDFEQAYPYQDMCVWFVCSCMTDNRQSLSLVPHRRKATWRKDKPSPDTPDHVAKSLHKNGPIFNNAYSVLSPYAIARFVSRCSAIRSRSRSRSLSYGLPLYLTAYLDVRRCFACRRSNTLLHQRSLSLRCLHADAGVPW